jgi:Putative transposase, YhgA-like
MTTADPTPEAPERAPHDGVFTMIAGDLTSAMALIVERLPPELVVAIVPGSLERDSTSFVGPALRRRYADVYFGCGSTLRRSNAKPLCMCYLNTSRRRMAARPCNC